MSDVIETMQIETENGPVTINKSDFKADTMTAFEAVVDEVTDISKMKVEQLKAALNSMGVEFAEDDKKADLVALLQDATDAE